MRSVILFCLFFCLSLPAWAQTDLARCQQSTPQFPQACACIINQAQAIGITGQTLSKLLINDTSGIPIITFQAYGAIYVQCIQSAVLGSVPASPMPAPVAPAPAAPAPKPPVTAAPLPAPASQPEAQTAGILGPPVQGPIVRGTRLAGPDGQTPLTIFIREDRPAGTWGRLSIIRGPGYQLGGVGVHDGAGRILVADCRPSLTASAPYLALAGIGTPNVTQPMQITVLRGNGSPLVQGYVRGQSVDGAVLLMPLYQNVADALRAGSRVQLALESGPTLEFGLRGSGAALGQGCASQRTQRWQYLAGDVFAPDGGWTKDRVRVVSRQALADEVLVHAAEAPAVPNLALTCDRRLAVRSPIFGYGATDRVGAIELPSGTIPLQFSPQGALDMASQPLTEAEIAALSASPSISITFDINMEPGDFTGATYAMDGFADALASLTCPAPPGPLGPTARVDVSALQNAWTPADIGWVFDGMSGSPAYTPGAFFTSDRADVPTLGMQCGGEPFVVDPWPGPSFTVRMDVDGVATDVPWSSSRAHYFPDYGHDAVYAAILNGNVLRMTLATDTRLDVAYSLNGLRQALAAAGCP